MSTSFPIKMTAAVMLASHTQGCNTQANVKAVTVILKTMFNDVNKPGHAAGTIRLAFHDAGTYNPNKMPVGGATGCLAAEDPDNAGLGRITEALDAILTDVNDGDSEICTRADLWYLATFVAIDTLVPSDEDKTFASAYTWGRVSDEEAKCDYKKGRLPSHQLNCDNSFASLQGLGFSAQEVVALMGAHSVGKAHTENSGFMHAWDDTQNVLDNHYYDAIMTTPWGRVANIGMTGTEVDIHDRYWFGGFEADEVNTMMLNVDMCLAFEVGNNDKDTPETAELSCQVNWEPVSFNTGEEMIAIIPSGANYTCPQQNDEFRNWTIQYQNDQSMFLMDFKAVMVKLSQLGTGHELCAPCEDDASSCCCGPDCGGPVLDIVTVVPSTIDPGLVIPTNPPSGIVNKTMIDKTIASEGMECSESLHCDPFLKCVVAGADSGVTTCQVVCEGLVCSTGQVCSIYGTCVGGDGSICNVNDNNVPPCSQTFDCVETVAALGEAEAVTTCQVVCEGEICGTANVCSEEGACVGVNGAVCSLSNPNACMINFQCLVKDTDSSEDTGTCSLSTCNEDSDCGANATCTFAENKVTAGMCKIDQSDPPSKCTLRHGNA